MAQFAIELSPEQIERLNQEAQRKGTSPQEHLQELVESLLESKRPLSFEEAAQDVLTRNAELYERLS